MVTLGLHAWEDSHKGTLLYLESTAATISMDIAEVMALRSWAKPRLDVPQYHPASKCCRASENTLEQMAPIQQYPQLPRVGEASENAPE